MIPKFEDLKRMTTEELVKEHDRHVDLMNTKGDSRQAAYSEYYRQEILEREQNVQTKKMLSYTWWIVVMTVIITVATLASLYFVYRSTHLN